jgi:protein TonB
VADYPEIARLAGMQGTVMVKVEVDVDGTVRRASILKGVHPLLDRPALAAARRLVFEPGTQRGMPVSCWVAVPFRFYLH